MQVPKGWRLGSINELIKNLESGVSVNGDDALFKLGDIGVLKVSAVTYGIFNPLAAKKIRLNEIERAKTNPAKGQIIISRSNTEALVGASAYIEKDYPNLYLPDKLWQTVPEKNSNMKWLSYVLASNRVRYALSNLATGTSGSMKNITKGELLNLKILIPPLEEQEKIAAILSTWDKAINITEKMIANSQEQKKALMQQLLTGKKRLLNSEGKLFSGDWEATKLLNIANIIMGSSPKSLFYNENGEGLPLIQGNADINNRVSVPRVFTSEITRECKIGDILLSVRAPVGSVAKSQHNACIGRGIAAIRANNTSNQEFLYQWLIWFEQRWHTFAQGSTFESINSDDIKHLKIVIPKKEEQEKIAEVLTTADQEIKQLKQKLKHLKQEKKALMQQLLTGKRRVIIENQ